MKTEREIREKISELFDKLPDIDDTADNDEREALYNQIDALLWVIGDRSGKPI